MQILFDDSKRIIGVYNDDTTVPPTGVYVINSPEIFTKLDKTSNTAHQQHDSAGRPLYSSAGKVTTSPTTRFRPNEQVTEQVAYVRPVSLKESPAEWSVEDVLREKYTILAAGRKYWFNQFLTAKTITHDSNVNKGVFGVSIPPQGELKFKPIELPNQTRVLNFYLEPNNGDFDIYVTTEKSDGEIKAKDNKVSFEPSKMMNIKVVNRNSTGTALPLKAFAFFYI